jgi:hypothetical protein
MYSTGGSGLGIRANEGIADFATESEFILNFSMILRVYDAYTVQLARLQASTF